MRWKYGSFSTGTKYRYTRGAPREYTCENCGKWMSGVDNCFPGTCSECIRKDRDRKNKDKNNDT